MAGIIEFVSNMDWKSWVVALNLLAAGIYGVALLIPGDSPDKQIKWFLDLTEKFSKKP